MNDLHSFFVKVSSFFLAIALAFSSLSFGNNLLVRRPPQVQCVIALLSDTHVTDELYRRAGFLPGLLDLSLHVKPDALVIAGDCTDNGTEENWAAFQRMLQQYARTDALLVTLGNHDTWLSYGSDDEIAEYAAARENYLRYSNAIMGTENTEVFFTRELCGYPFIVLGQEMAGTASIMTARELTWLEGALRQTAAQYPGKPIFVVNHQPMNGTHPTERHERGFVFDETSDCLREILDRYENIFYISGHQHCGLKATPEGTPEGFTTVQKVGDHITSINLPCYEYGTFLQGGLDILGEGIVMYVFADRVEFKGRNFFLSNWVTDFDVSVPLQ